MEIFLDMLFMFMYDVFVNVILSFIYVLKVVVISGIVVEG